MTKDNLCKGMFSFNANEILNSDDENKLWNAYEEVCVRISFLKTTKQDVPEEINELKTTIKNKINELSCINLIRRFKTYNL